MNIKPSKLAKQFLTASGVPSSLQAPFSINVTNIFTPINIGRKTVKLITPRQQVACWEYLQTIFDKPYILVMAALDNYSNARQLATILTWHHIKHALNETEDQTLPIWHIISSEFQNQLLVDFKNGQHKKPSLLILDNISSDMSSIKVDKVSDILQTMANRPIVIIYRGIEPVNFCIERLGIKPNYVMQIGSIQLATKRTKI